MGIYPIIDLISRKNTYPIVSEKKKNSTRTMLLMFKGAHGYIASYGKGTNCKQ
jgi:hypothetical protein